MKRNVDRDLDANVMLPPAPLGREESPQSDVSPASANGAAPDFHEDGGMSSRIDPWSLAEAIAKRWYWLVLGGIVFGFAAAYGGVRLWKTSYTASVQLVRHESPAMSEAFRGQPSSMQTFADLLRSPEVVGRVSAKAKPPIAPDDLAAAVRITPERNKESLVIAVTRSTPEAAVDLANLYAGESVQYTKELQARELASLNEHLQQQWMAIDQQARQLEERLRQPIPETETKTPAPTNAPTPAPSPAGEAPSDPLATVGRSMLVEQLRAANLELATLLGQYTEENPLAKAQRARLARLQAALKDDLAAPGNNHETSPLPTPQSTLTPLPPAAGVKVANNGVPELDRDVTRSRIASLESARLPLVSRQGLLQRLVDDPPGQLEVLIPARSPNVAKHGRDFKIIALTALAAMIGVVVAATLVLLGEAMSRRLKTEDDLRRVTRLPVIASLGDLRKMPASKRDQWSFRAWTALQGRLASPTERGLMCGIISSSDGEGRSTWTRLLAQAASQRGFRVLTITTQPGGSVRESLSNGTNGTGARRGAVSDAATVTTNVLASPGEVAHRLVGSDAHMVVDISLPDWSWNLERRKQLEAALNHWRAIDNIVILVNLPPASEPQAVLLAGELTNLVWLADSGRAHAAATRTQIEALRDNRCHLVGAVLNHAPSHPLKELFPRWVAA